MEKKIKILYVEDEADAAELYKGLLEPEGFEIWITGDATQALELFKRQTPDMVLLDLELPGKSGFDLIVEIKEIDPAMPVIILTSCGDMESLARAFELGADGYLKKEYEPEEIIIRLKAFRPRSCESRFDFFEISGGTTFNYTTRLLSSGQEERYLKAVEAKLLRLLCRRLNQLIDKEFLCLSLWGVSNKMKERNLDHYIVSLRKYLKADPSVAIRSSYGDGVCLSNRSTCDCG